MKHDTSSFANAMAKHLRGTTDLNKVQRWKDALCKAADISGLDVRKTANGDEAKCIELIVNQISRSVRSRVLSIAKHLVGIESHVEEVKSLLNVELGGVYFLGISGMGGVGKTTVARAIFDEISYQFQGSGFLANVRGASKKYGSESLEYLQKKLLSQILKQHSLKIGSADEGIKMLRFKKVLIILDDVDDHEQLNHLVGKREWFGDGSRIITTTRNNYLLRTHDKIYRVPQLAIRDALELFSWHAFQQGTPDKGFEEFSVSVVKYASGLPLALVVLGGLFYRLREDEWISALDRLKDIGNEEIVEKLSLSLDRLSHDEKDMFLDIACFLRGKKEDDVITILNSCGFNSKIGIHILTEKSLLYISEGTVEMHDLIEQMGQQVARDVDWDRPWKHSRLLHGKDIETVFSENVWTESIKGIMAPVSSDQHICKWSNAFRNMPCLRLLIVKGDEARQYDPISDPVEYLPSSLKWLEWSYYNFENLPENFQPRNLAGLHMPYSSLVEICKEPKTFDKLTILNLSFSENLLRTPDFSETPNLQRMILKGCVSLIRVHPSIGNLKKLILLDMKNCKNLKCLPNSIRMKSLKSLNFSGCEKLENFPEIRGNMEFLSELILARTAIQELPSSIGRLIGINLIDLSFCENLVTLPASIYEMKKLNILNLKGCSKLATLPDSLCDLEQLEEINAGNTAIQELPSSFGNLSKLRILSLKRGWKVKPYQSARSLIFPKSFGSLKELKILDLSGCNLSDKEINALICLTSLLELNLSRNKFISLPDSISQLSQLQYLNLTYCLALTKLPKLSPSIKELYAEDFLAPQAILDLPDYPKLYLLSFTNFSFAQQSYTEESHDSSLLDKILCLVLSILMANVIHPSHNIRHRVTTSVVFPGRAIPTWFNYQSTEEKISFKLPEFWCSPEFEGVAICCVTRMGAGVRSDSLPSGKYDYTFIKAKLSCYNYQEELKVLEKNCKVGTASRTDSWCVCFAYIPLCSLLVGSVTEVGNLNQYGVFEASIQRHNTRQWGAHLIYKTEGEFFWTILHDWRLGDVLSQEKLSQHLLLEKKESSQYRLSFNQELEAEESLVQSFSHGQTSSFRSDLDGTTETPEQWEESREQDHHLMSQEELAALMRRISRDSSLDARQKSHLIQSLLMSRWIRTQNISNSEVVAAANKKQKISNSEVVPGQYPSFRDQLIFGCNHYKRNCKLLAPCCKELFTCITCHDDTTDHCLDRKTITQMMCMKCLEIQPIGPNCSTPSCGSYSMGSYYCKICKLFDDERQIYHCPFCNLCRLGKGLDVDYFHCMRCNACISKSLSVHVCSENGLDANCPICHEFLFTSTNTVKALPCGHLMHSSCFQDYTCTHHTCPICSKSLVDMQVHFNIAV